MRVVYICAPYGPRVDTFVQAVAARPEVDLHCVLGLAPGVMTTPAGVDATILGMRRLRRGRTWTHLRHLRRTLDELGPDVVHVHGEPWSLVAVQAVAGGRGAVVIHGAETLYEQGGALESRARRATAGYVLERVGGFAGWAERSVDVARTHGLDPEIPTCRGPGVVPDVDLYRAARPGRRGVRECLAIDGSPVVAFVGRLVPEKGLEWLRQAFDRPRAADLRLLVVGDGPLRDWVHAWAADDARVQCFGTRDAAGVASLVAASDCLAVPSITTDRWEEQFGRVVAEACFAGTPAVVSSSGALPEVVGSTGRVVPEHDVDALAEALVEVALPREVDERAALEALTWGEEQYHPDVVAQRFVGFWADVLRRSRRADGP